MPRRSRHLLESCSLRASASSMSVAGKGGVADAHFADLGESGLQRRQQLGFQLTVDLVAACSPR